MGRREGGDREVVGRSEMKGYERGAGRAEQ